jgi:hypothetical protein
MMQVCFGLLLFIAVFSFGVCHSADDQKDDELKPLDPSKTIWQVKDGFPSIPITWPIPGGLKPCRLPDPVTRADFEEQLKRQEMRHAQELSQKEADMVFKQHQREMRIGGWLKMSGWILLVLAGIAHCATNLSIVKNYSTMLFFGGIGGILGGLAIQKTVQFDKLATVGFAIVIVGGGMFLLRKWSVSKLPGVSHAVSSVKRRMHEYKIETIDKDKIEDVR